MAEPVSNWLAAALEDVGVDAAKMAAMHFIWIFFSVSDQWELVDDRFAEAGSGCVQVSKCFLWYKPTKTCPLYLFYHFHNSGRESKLSPR